MQLIFVYGYIYYLRGTSATFCYILFAIKPLYVRLPALRHLSLFTAVKTYFSYSTPKSYFSLLNIPTTAVMFALKLPEAHLIFLEITCSSSNPKLVSNSFKNFNFSNTVSTLFFAKSSSRTCSTWRHLPQLSS